MTQRTKAELLTQIFQDGQAAGSITPSDIRDLIDSLTATSASARFTSPATFNIGTVGTFTLPSSGTSEIISGTSDIDMPQDGRIRYTGTVDIFASLTVSISATVAGNNQDIQFLLTRNGSALTETITGRTWSTGSDEGHLTIVTGLTLSPNDYIEIQAANNSSTSNITVINGVIGIHGHIG